MSESEIEAANQRQDAERMVTLRAMRQVRVDAWNEGYAAGQRDAYELEQAKLAGPHTAERLLAEGGTENPYAVDTPHVATIPGTTTPTNPELWK